RAETLALARALGRLPSLITVDIEAGFSDDPYDVADLAAELADAGAVGVNLEDGAPGGGLVDPTLHGAKITAVKDRVPELFVNARTDPFWLSTEAPLDEALRRAAGYVDAGADGIFVPGVADDDAIRTLVDEIAAPLNVLYLSDRHTLSGLARLRVARVSTGSLLFRTALGAAVRTAATIRNGGDRTEPHPPSYSEVQALTGQLG
ncbi:isocitrate lyase/phosphoenolpyruvate mutase family protein, partial [Micromonospora zhanjiangensis]